MLKKAEDAGHVPLRRTLTYAAALAINQEDPKLALNIVSGCSQSNYVTVRNLKALAFAKLGRLDDAFAILRSSLDADRAPNSRKRTFAKDVVRSLLHFFSTIEVLIEFELFHLCLTQMENIGSLVEQSGQKEAQLEFDRIKKSFAERELVEDQVCVSTDFGVDIWSKLTLSSDSAAAVGRAYSESGTTRTRYMEHRLFRS